MRCLSELTFQVAMRTDPTVSRRVLTMRRCRLVDDRPDIAAPELHALVCAVLGDPAVEVVYRRAADASWVDGEGRETVLDSSLPGVTVVAPGGEPVAALVHDPALVGDRERLDSAVRVAAMWLENERLEATLRSRLEEQEALRRVATLVARDHAPEEVFAIVTEEVARHLRADAAMTARYDGPGVATVLSDWALPGLEPFPTGESFELGAGTALAKVQATHAPARVDSYEGLDGAHPEEVRELGMRAGVGAPILVDGELWGAVAAGSADAAFPADAEERLGAFAELVAQALLNVDARMNLKQSRARIVESGDLARRKLERDLHDGAQQRLVSLALSLRLLAKDLEPDPSLVVEGCIDELLTALQELRDLARGIHPALLTERGLRPALEALAARSPIPVSLDATIDDRLPVTQEVALYYVAAEALANVAKYAAADSAEIRLRRADGWAEIVIADDGVGGARADGGSGIRGLADRVEALDGQLSLESPPGSGTTLRARVPLNPRGIESRA
jgi:signal transduction histidine kinase